MSFKKENTSANDVNLSQNLDYIPTYQDYLEILIKENKELKYNLKELENKMLTSKRKEYIIDSDCSLKKNDR